MTPELGTTLAGLVLQHPVLTAAGCAGTGAELSPMLDLRAVAAFVTPTVTVDPPVAHRPARLVETPSGLLHAPGTSRLALSGFLTSTLPRLSQAGVRTVVSVAGSSLKEYGELARRLAATPGITALEVNLAARNTESGGRAFGEDPYHAAKATAAVRRDTTAGRPVLAKLIPDVHSVVDVARAVVDASADGLVLVDGPRGLSIDTDAARDRPDPTAGRLSGPAIRPLAVRCVWEVHAAMPAVPVVAVGGVRSGEDALEMLLAGASAVQVGSVMLAEPTAPVRVVRELAGALTRRGIGRVADAVGRAHQLTGAAR